jgi:hypothetical protein
MTAILTEMPVSHAGYDFVRDRLAQGNALAKQILQSVALEDGQLTTFLPLGTSPQSQEQFHSGGKLTTPPVSEWKGVQSGDETLLMIPVPNTDYWLMAKIRDYLIEGKDRVCVIEDAVRRPSDAALHRLTTRHLALNGDVYHLLLQEDAQESRILEAIKAAKSIPTFVGAIGIWQGDPLAIRTGFLPFNELQSFAAGIQALFVGAFDGEGYLLWRKDAQQ